MRHRRRRFWVALSAAACVVTAARAQDEEITSELKTVATVRLVGRHSVPAREIRAVLKTRKPSILPWREKPVVRRDFLAADQQTIEAVYRQHGYLDATVEYRLAAGSRPNSAVVSFLITEGQQSKIVQVEFEGVTRISIDPVRRKLYARPKRAFNPAFLVADTTLISAAYKERGYLPHVVGSATRESLSVAVVYNVLEGPRYRNGEVYLSSPDERPVRRDLILRELLLKPGAYFRASRVQRSVERLYETGLLSQIQLNVLPDSSNTLVDYDLRVRARKPRWVDAGIGSGTAERFRFTGEWGHRNLDQRGLQSVLSSRLAFDGQARFLLTRSEASMLEPWLLHSRTRGIATLSYENRHDRADPRWDVKQEAKGATLQLRREIGRLARVSLTQDNTFVNQGVKIFVSDLPETTQIRLAAQVRPSYTTHRLQLAGERDSRDDPLNPARGSAQSLTAEVAGGPLKGTSSFTKLQMSSAWYSPFHNGWVFATRVRGGAIDPFGDRASFTPDADLDAQVDRVPLEDRFRIGGVNSLRGYNENEIPLSGGLAVLLANAELRIPVKGPVGVEIFVEGGNVWARPGYIKAKQFVPKVSHVRLDPGDVKYVFGAGARVNLPFGPLRIDFTWSPRPNEKGVWKVFEPQFAIGPAF